MKRFKVVVVGGTFDRLHKGHKALIAKAFEVGEHVVIGVTSDDFARRIGKELENPLEVRVINLMNYIQSAHPAESYEIHPLDDYFGPKVFEKDVEAIVVSEETAKRVEKANEVRLSKGIEPLHLIIVDTVLADDGLPISTTRIRRGEVDEDGRILR